MKNEKLIEKLIEGGAVRWTKYGKDRIYLRKFLEANIDLKISRYNTGNISHAVLDGEEISHTFGGNILANMDKAYYDVEKGNIKTWLYREDECVKIFKEIIEKVTGEVIESERKDSTRKSKRKVD